MNWNISCSINNNLSVTSMSDWFVGFSINFNCMFFSIGFSYSNFLIFENWSVNFRNCRYWNISIIAFFKSMNFAIRFILDNIFNSFSISNLFNWNISDSILYNWSDSLVSKRFIYFTINFDYN